VGLGIALWLCKQIYAPTKRQIKEHKHVFSLAKSCVFFIFFSFSLLFVSAVLLIIHPSPPISSLLMMLLDNAQPTALSTTLSQCPLSPFYPDT